MASKIFSRRRNADDDEVVSARASIRNHCLECMGYATQEVGQCTDPKCWLYPWRMGKTPARLKSRRKAAAFGKRVAVASGCGPISGANASRRLLA